jgi:hypothetical protein
LYNINTASNPAFPASGAGFEIPDASSDTMPLMPDIFCTARRIGDFESRTEEYELTFFADPSEKRSLEVKYQAARAFEINAALDASVETAREAISAAGIDARPTDETISQLAWKTLQSVKYDEGESKTDSRQI